MSGDVDTCIELALATQPLRPAGVKSQFVLVDRLAFYHRSIGRAGHQSVGPQAAVNEGALEHRRRTHGLHEGGPQNRGLRLEVDAPQIFLLLDGVFCGAIKPITTLAIHGDHIEVGPTIAHRQISTSSRIVEADFLAAKIGPELGQYAGKRIAQIGHDGGFAIFKQRSLSRQVDPHQTDLRRPRSRLGIAPPQFHIQHPTNGIAVACREGAFMQLRIT